MEIRQLEYFVAVAEEANFTGAAERVHISQSGVSVQIRRLEDDLGAPLIDRSSRTASLTSAGMAALDGARAVLAAVDGVRRAVDEVNGLVRGALMVGMVTGCTITPLFDALAAFHLAHPGVDITLAEDNSEHLLEGVRSGAVHMALVGTPTATLPGLHSFPIVRERLVALVPVDHPLAHQHATTLAEITVHPIVCLPLGTGVRAVFDQACVVAGISPCITMQASAPGAVVDLARRGMGVGVLSESMAPRGNEGLRALLIDDAAAPAVLALVWAPNESPALRELLDTSRKAFGGHPDATPSRP